MQITNLTKEDIGNCFKNLEKYLSQKNERFIKYAVLGNKIIRIISYSDEFLPHMEKQLTFVLRDSATHYDSTLVLWKEPDINSAAVFISDKFNPKFNMRIRIEQMYSGKKNPDSMFVIDKEFSKLKPVIDIQLERGFIVGNDYLNNTYYYGVRNLDPEEFIKEGHLFVQFFNNILKTSESNLAHGAVIGLNGDGILFCARGQRGKSTLSVLSMIKGFEYVSDDYLILHKSKEELLASPIYSIITLSPEMYNRLYDYLEGSRFVSNNARKDKYVFNISNFHSTFRKNYPIKVAMFPEIVSDSEPSITLCTAEEKGRAMVQLIQSTLMQTSDLDDRYTVKKMLDMIRNFVFYKFNLCRDIDKNTEFLRGFMNNFKPEKENQIKEPAFCTDLTFDLANILNSETGEIYSMNKLGTEVFKNLCKGVSFDSLKEVLSVYQDKNPYILDELELFRRAVIKLGIVNQFENNGEKACINPTFAEESGFKMSFIFHSEGENKELISKNKENENELCIK